MPSRGRVHLGRRRSGRDLFSATHMACAYRFCRPMAVGFAMILGVCLGLIAGYVGGWLDHLIMRFADIQMTFPSILIAMLIFGVAKGCCHLNARRNGDWRFDLVNWLSEWVQFARTVRGSTLVEKEKEYVAVAQLIGSQWQIMVRHILPNVLSPVLAIANYPGSRHHCRGNLSFLGVGAPRIEPSLGTLTHWSGLSVFWRMVDLAVSSPHAFCPALSVNLFGDWLRDTLNPRLK